MPKRKEDLTGRTFGRWTVVRFVRYKADTHFWECRCVCGHVRTIRGESLRHGRSRSCGCLKVEKARRQSRTHGLSKTPEYFAYSHAKNRCTDPRVKQWKDYGGRGIQFLFSSFEQFISELGPRPHGLTLDRINNDGHYAPGNVRWASRKMQVHNRRPRVPVF